MQYASSNVRAHAVERSHAHIGCCGYPLSGIQQPLSAPVAVHPIVVVGIVCHRESHQTVGYVGVANEDGQLGHHAHRILLTICHQALAVVGALVLVGCSVGERQCAGSPAGGQTAHDAAAQDEQHGSVEHLFAHQTHMRVDAYHHDGQCTSRVGVGQTEHQPHPIAVVTALPGHHSRCYPFGQHTRYYQQDHWPKAFGVLRE